MTNSYEHLMAIKNLIVLCNRYYIECTNKITHYKGRAYFYSINSNILKIAEGDDQNFYEHYLTIDEFLEAYNFHLSWT